MAGVQCRDEEPAGDEDEHHARDPEEANEVDLHAASIDPEPERDRNDDAEDRPAPGHCRARGLLERGREEHSRLEALADHGEERHADERAARAARQRARDGVLQIAAQVAGVAPHPDDHVGDGRRSDEGDQRLELLLLALGEVRVQHLQRNPEADAEEHRDSDSGPHRAQRIPAARAGEEGGDDDDDQRRFEALAEADDEGRQHVLAPVAGSQSDHVWPTLHETRHVCKATLTSLRETARDPRCTARPSLLTCPLRAPDYFHSRTCLVS